MGLRSSVFDCTDCNEPPINSISKAKYSLWAKSASQDKDEVEIKLSVKRPTNNPSIINSKVTSRGSSPGTPIDGMKSLMNTQRSANASNTNGKTNSQLVVESIRNNLPESHKDFIEDRRVPAGTIKPDSTGMQYLSVPK